MSDEMMVGGMLGSLMDREDGWKERKRAENNEKKRI